MPGVAQLGFAAFFAIIAVGGKRRVLRPLWVTWPCFALCALALVNGIAGLSSSNGGAFPLAPLGVLGFVLLNVTLSLSLLRGQPAVLIPASPLTDPSPIGLQASSV